MVSHARLHGSTRLPGSTRACPRLRAIAWFCPGSTRPCLGLCACLSLRVPAWVHARVPGSTHPCLGLRAHAWVHARAWVYAPLPRSTGPCLGLRAPARVYARSGLGLRAPAWVYAACLGHENAWDYARLPRSTRACLGLRALVWDYARLPWSTRACLGLRAPALVYARVPGATRVPCVYAPLPGAAGSSRELGTEALRAACSKDVCRGWQTANAHMVHQQACLGDAVVLPTPLPAGVGNKVARAWAAGTAERGQVVRCRHWMCRRER